MGAELAYQYGSVPGGQIPGGQIAVVSAAGRYTGLLLLFLIAIITKF